MQQWYLEANRLESIIDDRTVALYPIGNIVHDLLDARPELAPSLFCLHEWQEYAVSGVDSVKGASVEDRIGDQIFRIRFENQIGRGLIRLVVGRHRLTLPVEVLSNKFPEKESHLNFYSRLLDDLSQKATQLPFAISAPTSAGIDESPTDPSALFIYHFLRQYDADLRSAVQIIAAMPHRRLDAVTRWRPVAKATGIGAATIVSIMTHPEYLVPVGDLDLDCARSLHRTAPWQVLQELPVDTFDTPENRFAQAALKEFLRAVQDLPDQAWWKYVPPEDERDIRDLASFISETLTMSPFDEAGDMVVFPEASQVLLRRDGYRELLQLWRLFHLARHPFFANLEQAIDTRDVAKLYEYWCFFELGQHLSNVFDLPPKATLTISDEEGLEERARIEWPGRASLVFNRSFPRGRSQSYSVMLRPDFFLEIEEVLAPRRRLVFDAKFRFTTGDWHTVEDDDSPLRQVKHADIYKMHTYRDALAAQAAIVLYPGDQPIFYDAEFGPVMDEVTLAGILHAHGVGGFCMEPHEEINFNGKPKV